MKNFWRRFRRPILIGLPLLLLAVIFVDYEFKHTSTNQYCGTTCHLMTPYYESSFHNIHREQNRVNCRDCHIPEDNIAEALVYKAYSGARDYYKNTFSPPKALLLTEWSKNIIQRNCTRCHQSVVQNVNMSNGPRCFECHRGIPHEQVPQAFSSEQIITPIR